MLSGSVTTSMCLEGPLNATESTVPARFRPTRVGASLTHLCPQSSQRSRAQRKHPTREPLSDHRTRRCRTGTPGLAAVEDDVCIKTCIYSRVPNTALGGRQGGDYLALTKRDAEAQRGTHSDPAKATQQQAAGRNLASSSWAPALLKSPACSSFRCSWQVRKTMHHVIRKFSFL